jgi:hypothetical protein
MGSEDDAVLEAAINSLNRDPVEGEVLCRWHMIQWAVGDDGKRLKPLPCQTSWGQVVNKQGEVVDAPIAMLPSSMGMCEACWHEQHSQEYTVCGLHGIQPRPKGGSEVCAICIAKGLARPVLDTSLFADGEGPEDETGAAAEPDRGVEKGAGDQEP